MIFKTARYAILADAVTNEQIAAAAAVSPRIELVAIGARDEATVTIADIRRAGIFAGVVVSTPVAARRLAFGDLYSIATLFDNQFVIWPMPRTAEHSDA